MPLHSPALYSPSAHCVFAHFVHVPRCCGVAPLRYCSLGHCGWSSHVYPLDVPNGPGHSPVRYCLEPPSSNSPHVKLPQISHVPFCTSDAPSKYWNFAKHVGCGRQLNEFVVPVHSPALYSVSFLHDRGLQSVHDTVLRLPPHVPVKCVCWCVGV